LTEDYSNLSSGQLDQQITATTAAIESTTGRSLNPPAEKEGIFSNASDGKLTAELGRIFDKSEARADAIIDKKSPPTALPNLPYDTTVGPKPGSFDEAFSKTFDWLSATEAQRAEMRDVNKLVTRVQENAKKFGITLDGRDTLFAAMELQKQEADQAKAEHGPVVDHVRAAFGDSSTPVEGAKLLADTKLALDRDIVGGIGQIAQLYNVHPLAIAQELARRFGNAPQQAQYQAPQQDMAQLEAIVADFTAKNPRLNDLEAEVTEILQSDTFQQSNQPPAVKLKAALDVAVKRDKAGSLEDRLDRTMARAYAKANRKRS
jgi:hypothetical protein